MPSIKEFKLKEKSLKAQAKEISDARLENRHAMYQELLSRFEELERRNEVQLKERLRWGVRYYSTNFEFYVSSCGEVSCTYRPWANQLVDGTTQKSWVTSLAVKSHTMVLYQQLSAL